MNTQNIFKSIGAEYTDEYSNSEDAWEFAFSNDQRVIDALTNNTPDERAEAADEFGTGFTDAYVSEPEVEKQEKWDTGGIADYAPDVDIADAVIPEEKQHELELAATALQGEDGYEWLTDGVGDSYLAGLDAEGVKAYVLDYADIVWGGDAHLPKFNELTVREFVAVSDYDTAVTAVTEAVQAAKGRMKERKPKFLSGTVQVKVDLKHEPLVEGGIPAPRTWIEVLSDDTNDGRGYDVDYTPFSSLGHIFNAANVCRAEKNGTYATRGEAWLAAEAFNTSEAARQRHLQG